MVLRVLQLNATRQRWSSRKCWTYFGGCQMLQRKKGQRTSSSGLRARAMPIVLSVLLIFSATSTRKPYDFPFGTYSYAPSLRLSVLLWECHLRGAWGIHLLDSFCASYLIAAFRGLYPGEIRVKGPFGTCLPLFDGNFSLNILRAYPLWISFVLAFYLIAVFRGLCEEGLANCELVASARSSGSTGIELTEI